MHSLIAVIGALVAAVGGGVLLARCFRAPRGDLIAWSVALLALLVSLGAQAMGAFTGFDSATFRAMELGGQVIAPLAVIVGLSEVAAKSTAARFCARLYIPALGIVAVVVLALDQLTTAKFSKAFPPAATFYQAPPNYTLMYALGPVTAVVAAIAVLTVLSRAGQPGWRDLVPVELMAGAAGLALAYPALAQLVMHHIKLHLPLGSVFGILCTLAAALTWLAGVQSSRADLAVLHGLAGEEEAGGDSDRRPAQAGAAYDYRAARGPGRRGADGLPAGSSRADGRDGRRRDDRYQDDRYFDSFGEGGVYRSGGLYRAERPAQEGHPGRDAGDRAGGGPEVGYADFATGDFLPGVLGLGGLDQAGRDDDGEAEGSQAVAAGTGRVAWQSAPSGGPSERGSSRWQEDGAGERGRADPFGQITIYTLREDCVADFDRLTERVIEQVRKLEPDTLVFISHAVPSASTQRILYQVYRSRAAYQRHLVQPHIQQFDIDRRRYVVATNVVELGLQQAKVSPFPSVEELFPEPGYDTSGFERPDYLRDYGRTSASQGDGSREPR